MYTVKELHEILRISRPTVHELLKKNEFRWIQIGTKYRISKKNFEKWYSVQSVYRKVNHIPTADELEEEYIYLQDAAKLSRVTQSTITKWDASWKS